MDLDFFVKLIYNRIKNISHKIVIGTPAVRTQSKLMKKKILNLTMTLFYVVNSSFEMYIFGKRKKSIDLS